MSIYILQYFHRASVIYLAVYYAFRQLFHYVGLSRFTYSSIIKFYFNNSLFPQITFIQLFLNQSNIKITSGLFSMSTKLQNDILQCCKQINEKCEIQFKDFAYHHLRTRQWYLSVLEILFPHFQQKIQKINQIHEQSIAITAIVQIINDLDQFEILEIDGKKIVNGDDNQIANMVQIILTLLQIALQQYEQNENNQNRQIPDLNNEKKSPQVHQKKIRQKKSLSNYSKSKSVQAIDNQFQQSQQSENFNNNVNVIPFKNNQQQQNDHFKGQYKDKFDGGNKLKRKNYAEQLQNQQQRNKTEDKLIEKIPKIKKTIKDKKQKYRDEANLVTRITKKKKQLITHPKNPQILKKAKSTDAIILTKKIQQNITKIKNTNKKQIYSHQLYSPTSQQIKRKNKEQKFIVKGQQHAKKQYFAAKRRRKDYSNKNEQNLQKLLNWREQRIKKQRKQYEQAMKMKLSDQKQQYIKAINKLILDLQRDKQIQEKKDFKQGLIKDNQQAVIRLTALEQWYKNKLNYIKQYGKNKKQERVLIKTGHKQIIGQIQKYLKKENEEKLIQLTQKYRIQQSNIENDYEKLAGRIRKVYHKN